MSKGGGGGAGGGQYRTQSDTLKLQRLIEVLKQRGSDLAGSLETSAADFLTDVKPRTVDVQDGDDGGSSGAGSDCLDAASETVVEAVEASDLSVECTDSSTPVPLPLSPEPSDDSTMHRRQSKTSDASLPPKKKDSTASMVMVAAATAAAPAVAEVLQLPQQQEAMRRRVHFEGLDPDSQSPTPTASEASVSPLMSPSSPLPPQSIGQSTASTSTQSSANESGGTIITELVRKSSEVLNLLTMSMVDTKKQQQQQQAKIEKVDSVESRSNISFEIESCTSASVEDFAVEMNEEEDEEEEDDESEYLDDEEEDDATLKKSAGGCLSSRFDLNDPPDPRELAKVHNRKWKKAPTMALRWRRQRERMRRLQQQQDQ